MYLFLIKLEDAWKSEEPCRVKSATLYNEVQTRYAKNTLLKDNFKALSKTFFFITSGKVVKFSERKGAKKCKRAQKNIMLINKQELAVFFLTKSRKQNQVNKKNEMKKVEY